MMKLSFRRWLAMATIGGLAWAISLNATIAQDAALPPPTPTPSASSTTLDIPMSPAQPTSPARLLSPTRPRGRIDPPSQLAGFKPIGSLTASGSIGTSLTGADVDASDRPDLSVPDVETIEVAHSASYQNWTPISPIRSSAMHQPHYFEDTNLERYGTSRFPRLQPLCSAAHFGATVATLPYQMAIENPGRLYQYSHPFEAGRYGHRQRTLPAWDRRGALTQTAVVLGLIFILP